ncbi:unnamed protein product [Rotaria sordida]|uniref:NAD(+)--protein-arginine ADP-ribosyltransferase n=1 Tax=Rotaria sordida TaxID=392033 RepID=A0A815SCH5_9BILA|nr:unnamed protein product [Rotaria sordida]
MGNKQQKDNKELSELYKAADNGDLERVRRLLPLHPRDQIIKPLEPNGDTALHTACRQGFYQIAFLLRQEGMRSDTKDSSDKTAYEVAANDEIRALLRPGDYHDENVKRFHETGRLPLFDALHMFYVYSNEKDAEKNSQKNQGVVLSSDNAKQTRYMVRFNKSPAFIRNIAKKTIERQCIESLQSIINEVQKIRRNPEYDIYFNRFKTEKNPDHLLRLYTFNDLFKVIRENPDAYCALMSLHLERIAERAYKGKTYRGITMTKPDIARHYYAFKTKGCVMEMRNFSSTSKDRLVAQMFSGFGNELDPGLYSVLFTYEFLEPCPTALNLSRVNESLGPISNFGDEEEILILPYTLFRVVNVTEQTGAQPFTLHLQNVRARDASLLSFIRGDIGRHPDLTPYSIV